MTWLDRELTSLAFVWRLERRDGIVIGLTSHDQPLMFQGVLCRSAPGLTPSAIEQDETMGALTVELAGGLSSEALTADDLAGGRWDGARVSLHAVDWTAPEEGAHLIARGTLGEVSTTRGGFSAELRESRDWMEAPCAPSVSPECRAELGDARCRVDLSRRTRLATVISANGGQVTLSAPMEAAQRFAFGMACWTDGRNAGLRQVIVQAADALVTLREAPAFPVVAGDRLRLTEGCDGRLATCRTRFDNVVNFRGEPHVPGMDLLHRYAR